jgi:hypothetical protein
MSDDLQIRIEPTPNPNAVKLSTNRPLAEGRAQSYTDPAQAFASPLARALFAVPGVVGVFLLRDFVTVTRDPDAAWETILPSAEGALRRALGEK